jgi:GAF domain-containing protein
VTTAPDHVSDVLSDTVAAIASLLVARHDGLTVLSAVTEACRTLLAADATGVVIVDPRGGVEVLAASEERARLVELLQTQADEGPCLDCISHNAMITSTDLVGDRGRWPVFAPAAVAVGFRAIYAVPLRLMDSAVGGVNLLYTGPTELSAVQMRLAQSLADFATLGLTQERDQRRLERLTEQTLMTLNDRIQVGHAVGIVASGLGVESDVARARLRTHSLVTGTPLRDVARAVTDGVLAAHALIESQDKSSPA